MFLNEIAPVNTIVANSHDQISVHAGEGEYDTIEPSGGDMGYWV